jgi:hypothetical protein
MTIPMEFLGILELVFYEEVSLLLLSAVEEKTRQPFALYSIQY